LRTGLWRRSAGGSSRRRHCNRKWLRRSDDRGNLDDRSGRASTLDMHLYVAALELELGDVLLHQKLDELFNFFLIH
jgi:hypothetical protein